MPDPTAALADLEALAAGELSLDDFGVWVPPTQRPDGTKSWPYVAYTERFQAAQAVLNALLQGQPPADYVAWQGTFVGPLDDPATIATMDDGDLFCQLTRMRRGERFSDGFSLRMVESGAMLAALRRGLEILR